MTLRHLKRRAFAVSLLAAGALVVPLSAGALDINGDGVSDFYLREQPSLPYANVGSNCDVWKSGGPYHARLYVRPPLVRGLPGLGRQRVTWRARFYDRPTGETRARGSWVYRRVSPRQATSFGGGPNAGNGVMITHNQYWAASQYYDHPTDDGDRIRAIVDVGWYNATTRRWIMKALHVQWVITTVNRTIGQGQTGPYSTPVKAYTC